MKPKKLFYLLLIILLVPFMLSGCDTLGYEDSIGALQNRIEELENTLDGLQDDIEEMQSKIDSLQNETNLREDEITIVETVSLTPVVYYTNNIKIENVVFSYTEYSNGTYKAVCSGQVNRNPEWINSKISVTIGFIVYGYNGIEIVNTYSNIIISKGINTAWFQQNLDCHNNEPKIGRVEYGYHTTLE